MMDGLDEIIPLIKAGKCVLFIGSGVSSLAGCSDWNKLVASIMQHKIITNSIKPNEISSLITNDAKLEYCKIQFEKNNLLNFFWGEVRKALINYDRKLYNEKYLELIKALKRIAPFPKIIITTNIDNLLEETGLFDYHNVFYKIEDFSLSLHPEGLFHIHGYIESLENALFVSSQYVPRYSDPNFKNFLTTLAKNNSFLFLGSKVERVILENILLTTKGNGVSHFMLAHDQFNLSESDKTIYSDVYNVKVVKYGDKKNFNKNIQSWIDNKFPETSAKITGEEDVTHAVR